MKAIVVGGGPAGASAALGLLSMELEVSLYEQRTGWPGRVCGSFLNPESVRHLRWLGLESQLMEAGAVEISVTRVTAPSGFQSLVATQQNDVTAMAIPRKNLEEVLLDAVERRGGTIHLGTRVMDVESDSLHHNVSLRDQNGLLRSEKSDFIVYADGRYSLNEPLQHKPHQGWFGWNATFTRVQQKPGTQSLHFYPGGYVGVVTYADRTSNVCGLIHLASDDHRKWSSLFEDALRQSAPLREILSTGHQETEWRGVGPLPFSSHLRESESALLVGDAAAVGDPFMGEGIGRALGAGPLLFTTLQNSRFLTEGNWDSVQSEYRKNWNRAYQRRLWLGRVARWFLNRPRQFLYFSRLLFHPKVLNWITPAFHVGFEFPVSLHE